jgi:hypothetical protein
MSAGYLAVDLGAESGRVVLGRFDGKHVLLEEIHRFLNLPVRLPDGLHWDVLRILYEIKEGLAKAVRGEEIEGVGVDSWGVDFGLLDRDGALVSNPYHHRDTRTEGMIEEAFRLVQPRRSKIRSSDSVQPHLSVTTLGQPGREPRPGRLGILGLTPRAGYRPRRARSGTVPSSLTKPGISIGPANVSSPGLLEAHCCARTSARSPYQ